MKKYIPMLIVLLLVAIPALALTVLNSQQIAPNPANGNCLTTNGANPGVNTWGSCGNSTFPFTSQYWGNSTSTTLGFTNGFFSTASSTQSGNFFLPSLTQGFTGIGTNGIVYTFATSTIKGSQINNDSNWIASVFADSPFGGNGTSGSHLTCVTCIVSNLGDWAGTWQTFSPSHFQTAGTYLTAYDAWSHPYSLSSATTSILYLNGFTSNASSTIAGQTNLLGNVGIGTTTPVGRFAVLSADNTLATNIGEFRALNLSQGVGISYTGIRKLTTNGANDLYIDGASGTTGNIILNASSGGSTGNVGMGTTTPGSLLSIGNSGGINFVPTATSTFSSSANGINITNGCYAIGSVCIGSGGAGSGTVNTGGAGQLAWYASDGTAVSATSTDGQLTIGNLLATSTTAINYFGNSVGIGTSSPQALLEIGTSSSSGPAGGLYFAGDTNVNLYKGAAGVIQTNATTLKLAGTGGGNNATIAGPPGAPLNITSNKITAGTALNISNSGTNIAPASGSTLSEMLLVSATFVPTLSSVGGFNFVDFQPTIRQTGVGSGSGITRGLLINPQLTSAADFRALEIGTSSANFILTVSTTTSNNVIFNAFTISSTSAVTLTNAINQFIPGGPRASTNVTISTSTGLVIGGGSSVLGATTSVLSDTGTGVVTNSYGLEVYGMTGATNNYAAIFNGGNVGIGTLSPVLNLDVQSAASSNNGLNVTDGTNFLRLFGGTLTAGGYSGLSQTGDTGVVFGGGSGGLVIAPNSVSAIGMRMTSGGSVGIATTSPWRTLSVTGSVAITGLTNSNTGDYVCLNTTTFELEINTATCSLSDIRTKQSIRPFKSSLDSILKVPVVTFQYKPEENKGSATHIGLIAQDVQKIFPLAVTTDEKTGLLGLDFNQLTAVLWKGFQELVARVSGLEAKVNAQQKQIDHLQQEIDLLNNKK